MKKILLGVVAVLLVGGLTGAGVVFLQTNTQSPSQEKQVTETKTLPSTSLKEYADPSGFTLSYPDDLSIAANDTDESTYADVDFTSKNVDGAVNINIVDSKLKSLAEWLDGEDFAENASIKDVRLGEMVAKEVRETDGITLAAIDQGVLFTVTANLKDEKDFWEATYEKIVSSFAFAQPEQQSTTTSGSSGSSSDIIFEGEEVVE